MVAKVSWFPEQASTIAERVDALFLFQVVVTGAVALLITVLVLYFAIKYHRRSDEDVTPRLLGSVPLELFWTIAPLAIFIVMFLWGAHIHNSLTQAPPDALQVYVVGKQWMWKIQHADGQREINELHVPLGKPIRLTLTSEDVIHDFALPAFRTKIDVLPDRYVSTWFQATRVGRYDIFCNQYCGTNHSGMIGTVVVMTPQDFEIWLSKHAEGSLALQGRKLFLKLQCVSCHSGDSQARAPVLENLHGRVVPLQDGRHVIADDAYLRESILYPRAKIVQGWEPIMPTFKGQISEDELIQLLAYLKSLEWGQTPVRTEEFPPPIGAPTVPETERSKP